jgi:hypothetical protein
MIAGPEGFQLITDNGLCCDCFALSDLDLLTDGGSRKRQSGQCQAYGNHCRPDIEFPAASCHYPFSLKSPSENGPNQKIVSFSALCRNWIRNDVDCF